MNWGAGLRLLQQACSQPAYPAASRSSISGDGGRGGDRSRQRGTAAAAGRNHTAASQLDGLVLAVADHVASIALQTKFCGQARQSCAGEDCRPEKALAASPTSHSTHCFSTACNNPDVPLPPCAYKENLASSSTAHLGVQMGDALAVPHKHASGAGAPPAAVHGAPVPHLVQRLRCSDSSWLNRRHCKGRSASCKRSAVCMQRHHCATCGIIPGEQRSARRLPMHGCCSSSWQRRQSTLGKPSRSPP